MFGLVWVQSVHEGRIYTLKLFCDKDYPDKPPTVRFHSRINMTHVNQETGLVSLSWNLAHLNLWQWRLCVLATGYLDTEPNPTAVAWRLNLIVNVVGVGDIKDLLEGTIFCTARVVYQWAAIMLQHRLNLCEYQVTKVLIFAFAKCRSIRGIFHCLHSGAAHTLWRTSWWSSRKRWQVPPIANYNSPPKGAHSNFNSTVDPPLQPQIPLLDSIV